MKRWTNLYMIAGFTCGIWLAVAALANAATEDLDDRDITLAVESRLLVEDAVPSHRIDVSTQNGVVTLSGSVNHYYTKLLAKMATESVKGVVGVLDHVEVQSTDRLDSRIRSDVVSELMQDPVTDAFDIDVNVEEGVVTLTGEVDSYAEKTLAESVAAKVHGVTDVTNQLTYDLIRDRSDAEIQLEVRSRLRANASINSGLLSVTVDDGQVTLAGSTASRVEKTAAAAEAWTVPGVQSVTNNIEVQWWLTRETSDWSDEWTDEDMRRATESAMRTNPRVNSSKINTTVENGVATLTGMVSNMQAKRAAEKEAQDILGVWRVRNFLRVRPTLVRTDAAISQDIREALHRSPHLDGYDIAINVSNGMASLTGEVDSRFQKSEAEELAAGVPGVVAIRNRLEVDYPFTAKTDREIKEDIQDQLHWSPFVDSEDITVEVHSGVATLKGSVNDWNELQAARENARDGGAVAVINKLSINNASAGTD